jgi:hypothetical protein
VLRSSRTENTFNVSCDNLHGRLRRVSEQQELQHLAACTEPPLPEPKRPRQPSHQHSTRCWINPAEQAMSAPRLPEFRSNGSQVHGRATRSLDQLELSCVYDGNVQLYSTSDQVRAGLGIIDIGGAIVSRGEGTVALGHFRCCPSDIVAITLRSLEITGSSGSRRSKLLTKYVSCRRAAVSAISP